MKKVNGIIKIIDKLMKNGCDRFEPKICNECKEAKKEIEKVLEEK